MSDPLAQFRRPQPQALGAASATGAVPYEAFKPVDRRQIRLAIRPANSAWNRVPYGYLLRIVEDGPYGTELCLVYDFMVVVILGRNLYAIGDAIADERCEFIQAFDGSKWEKPTDSAAPFIESIQIHLEKTPNDVLSDLDGQGEARH